MSEPALDRRRRTGERGGAPATPAVPAGVEQLPLGNAALARATGAGPTPGPDGGGTSNAGLSRSGGAGPTPGPAGDTGNAVAARRSSAATARPAGGAGPASNTVAGPALNAAAGPASSAVPGPAAVAARGASAASARPAGGVGPAPSAVAGPAPSAAAGPVQAAVRTTGPGPAAAAVANPARTGAGPAPGTVAGPAEAVAGPARIDADPGPTTVPEPAGKTVADTAVAGPAEATAVVPARTGADPAPTAVAGPAATVVDPSTPAAGSGPAAGAATVGGPDGNGPAGILARLAATAPSTAEDALTAAEAVSGPALEAERAAAAARLPSTPAPTGMPPLDVPAEAVRGAPPIPAVPAVGVPGAAAPQAGAPEQAAAVPEVPPSRSAPPTVLPGPETPVDDRDRARQEAAAQQELDAVALETDAVPTCLGPRPVVPLTGESDPALIDAGELSERDAVARTRAAAAATLDGDHGVGSIAPEATGETLSATLPTGTARPAGAAGGAAALSPDVAAGLDASLAPGLRERLSAEHETYLAEDLRHRAAQDRAHAEHAEHVAELTAATAEEQRGIRDDAGADVVALRAEGREEMARTEREFGDKAGAAALEHRTRIETEERSAAERVESTYADAEGEAEEKTRRAHADAETEKRRAREESDGFWGWAKRAAAAFVDALKATITVIFDGLRAAVRGAFALAKKIATGIIEITRRAVIGIVRAYGVVLKGLAAVALAGFPDTARRVNAAIDRAVAVAVDGVNAAAAGLSRAVQAALDFLASTIDSLLGLIQSVYTGILTVIGMLVRGELRELIAKLGNVVAAARAAPELFETAAYEELLGGDFDQPLSPMELAQAGIRPPSAEGAPVPGPDAAGTVPRPPWGPHNVGVDHVVEGAELAPEAEAELVRTVPDGGSTDVAESPDEDRTMAAIMAEATGGGDPAVDHQRDTAPERHPDDGLDARGRAEVRWTLLKRSLAAWWEANKVAVVAGAVAAVLGIAALIFFSGGSILAAIGPIMTVLGPLFVGATIAAIGGHVRDFVAKSWEGDVRGGAKSLAKALAAGAVELISWITFKAGGAAIRGAKAAAKSGVRLARAGLGSARRLVATGAKFVIERGRVVLRGLGDMVVKQFTSLRRLGAAALQRLRFRKLRIRRKGRWWALQALINPWFTIMSGLLQKVDGPGVDAVEMTDEVADEVRAAGSMGTRQHVEAGDVLEYRESRAGGGKGRVGDKLTGDHGPSAASIEEQIRRAAAAKKVRPKRSDIARARNEGVSVVLPDWFHQKYSRTWGSRNKALFRGDAQDFTKAIHDDTKAILVGLEAEGMLTKKWVGSYLKAYNMNVARGRGLRSPETEKLLLDYLRRAK